MPAHDAALASIADLRNALPDLPDQVVATWLRPVLLALVPVPDDVEIPDQVQDLAHLVGVDLTGGL